MSHKTNRILFYRILALAGLFIFLFLPLEFFENQAQRIYENEKEVAITDLKDRLLQEISDFQLDLRPENYIQKVFEEFENELFKNKIDVFGKADQTNSFAQLDCNKFNFQMQKHLWDKFKIKPVFIVSTPADFSEVVLEAGENLVKNGFSHKELTHFFIDAGLCTSADNKGRRFHDKVKELYRTSEKLFSTYNNQLLENGLVNRVFSDLYGFQNLFLFHKKLELHGKTIGYFSAGIIEKSLNLEAWENFAVSHASPNTRRKLLNKIDAEKFGFGFIDTEKGLAFTDRISADYAAVIRSISEKDVDLKNFEKVLLVESDPESPTSLIKLLQALRWIKKIVLLFFFAFAIQLWINGVYIPLNLRRKFILIAATVLIPPAVLLSIFLILTEERVRSDRFALAKSRLNLKLQNADMLLQESNIRQSMATMALKDHLMRIPAASFNPNHISHEVFKRRMPYMRMGSFYTSHGKFISSVFGDDAIAKEASMLVANNSVRFLNNLIELDTGRELVRKQLEKLQYTDAFIGDFIQLFEDMPSIMAEEVINNPDITKGSSLSRMNFCLFPDLAQKPIKPWAIAFFDSSRFSVFKNLFRREKKLPISLLYESDSEVEYFINYAVRNTHELESIDFKNVFRGWPDMTGIFNNAMATGSSGSRTIRSSNYTEIHMWIFNETSAILLAGICRIREGEQGFLIGLLPLFSLVLVLISLLVLSEIIGWFFLQPVRALQFCADSIAKTGQLNVGLKIESNDEFAHMGQAFNQMVGELLQKQRLSRLVSGRLISRLEGVSVGQKLAERVYVSILFSDLRNFTTISENNSAVSVVEMLNQYFTEMEKAIVACNGIIDRFIGDAIVAVFFPDNCPEAVEVSACRAALSMRKKLAELNRERKLKGLFTIENGIGIASGEVVSGSIGQSGQRKEYAVIGKPFARAAELESHCKLVGSAGVIVDENTFVKVGDRFHFNELKHFCGEFHLEKEKSNDE